MQQRAREVSVFAALVSQRIKSSILPKLNLVTMGCGQTSVENCTYFDSNNVAAGGCSATICPCGNNICQVSQKKVKVSRRVVI